MFAITGLIWIHSIGLCSIFHVLVCCSIMVAWEYGSTLFRKIKGIVISKVPFLKRYWAPDEDDGDFGKRGGGMGAAGKGPVLGGLKENITLPSTGMSLFNSLHGYEELNYINISMRCN